MIIRTSSTGNQDIVIYGLVKKNLSAGPVREMFTDGVRCGPMTEAFEQAQRFRQELNKRGSEDV